MVDEATVTTVERYLQACRQRGIQVSFGVIFGSRARGKANLWSDIDVVVVSPQFDAAAKREYVNLLWRIAGQVDSQVEPVPCGERQWEHDDVSTIIEVARREGLRVDLPAGTPLPRRA